jgi:hypothetical protein
MIGSIGLHAINIVLSFVRRVCPSPSAQEPPLPLSVRRRAPSRFCPSASNFFLFCIFRTLCALVHTKMSHKTFRIKVIRTPFRNNGGGAPKSEAQAKIHNESDFPLRPANIAPRGEGAQTRSLTKTRRCSPIVTRRSPLSPLESTLPQRRESVSKQRTLSALESALPRCDSAHSKQRTSSRAESPLTRSLLVSLLESALTKMWGRGALA